MSIEFQKDIRQNAQELNNYVKDLHSWNDVINKKTKVRKSEDIEYPIRKLKNSKEKIDIGKFRKNKTTIDEYYNAWENLDVVG